MVAPSKIEAAWPLASDLKTIHRGRCWRSRDKFTSEVFLSYGNNSVRRPAKPMSINYVRTLSAVWRTCSKLWTIVTDSERESRESVLLKSEPSGCPWLQSANLFTIYIYIYICVCVCVCVIIMHWSSPHSIIFYFSFYLILPISFLYRFSRSKIH